MHFCRILIILSISFILVGCVPQTTKKEAFPQMYNEHPLSILVLPPINASTAADAREYYSATIAEPLTLMGYYVFPIEVTTEVLRNEGFYDTEMFINTPPQKFKQYFGADSVLYVKILKWDTSYFVIGGNLTVSIDCTLKSTNSGEILWKYDGTVVVDTSGGSGGGGLGGLIAKVIITAIQTAAADYVPIARQANFMTMSSMPFGKYHSMYNQDGNVQIIKKNSEAITEAVNNGR